MFDAGLHKALDRVAKDWPVIKPALVTVVLLMVVVAFGVGGGVWWLATTMSSEREKIQQATITNLQTTIDHYRVQIDQLREKQPQAAPVITAPAASSHDSAAAHKWFAAAAGQLGVNTQQNVPQIIEYITTVQSARTAIGRDNQILVEWSSHFVEWSVQKAGLNGPRKPDPFAWLDWGMGINDLEAPCIVVLQLASGIRHVAFFSERIGENIRVLGGYHPIQASDARGVNYRLISAASVVGRCRMPL